MSETWRAVAGYEGHYEVSDQGRVRSLTRMVDSGGGRPRTSRGRVLSASPTNRVYLRVCLCLDSKSKQHRVHRLVAIAFVAGRAPGLVVCHLDGNPLNNHASNLRWGTASDNMLDAVRHGTHNFGSRNHCGRGHEYTEENTKWNGHWRICIACIGIHRQVSEANRLLRAQAIKA